MSVDAGGIYPAAKPEFAKFASRRSVVHGTNGIVSSTQPLASAAGQRVLREGGNAAVRLQMCAKYPAPRVDLLTAVCRMPP